MKPYSIRKHSYIISKYIMQILAQLNKKWKQIKLISKQRRENKFIQPLD